MKRHSKDAFSREPEVGVVTAKTTYHTKSTQVPLHKVKKKNQKQGPKQWFVPLSTISLNFIQTTKYSSSQFTQLVPLTIHKKKENTRLGSIQSGQQFW